MKSRRGSRKSIRYSIFIGVLAGSVFSGSGAHADLITSQEDLALIDSGTSYSLSQDIEVAINWTPLNYSDGTFNGNGFAITGLNRPLFDTLGSTNPAETTVVKNLKVGTLLDPIVISEPFPQGLLANFSLGASLETEKTTQIINVDVNGTINNTAGLNNVGGLVGSITDTEIINSSAVGSVTGTGLATGGIVGYADNSIISGSTSNAAVNGVDFVGGLVGHSFGTTITFSSATGTVIATGWEVGGLIGKNENNLLIQSTVTKSFATGDVTGVIDVGGFIGKNIESEVSESFSRGTQISGTANVGGLIGWTNGNIYNSYATGNVSATQNTVGGLVGHAESISPTGIISNSYATGNVTGDSYETGGFIGFSFFNISNSYSTGDVTGGASNEPYFMGDFFGAKADGVLISNSYASGDICPKADLGVAVCDVTDVAILQPYELNPLFEFPSNPLSILTTDSSPGSDIWNRSCMNKGNPYLISLAGSYESTCLNTGKKSEYKKIDREPREVTEVRNAGTIEKSVGFKNQSTLPKDSAISFLGETVKIDLAKIKAVTIAPTANVKVTAKAGEALQISLKSESKEPVELWVKSADGKWLLAGVITFDKDGKAVLPPLQFKNAGNYSLVLSKPTADSAQGKAPLNQTGSLLVAVS